MGHASACPVCQARFRGSSECSRCGADLKPIMTVAAQAWRLRELAREAIFQGDAERARELAAGAQQLCRTVQGGRIEALSQWLIEHTPAAADSSPNPVVLQGAIDSPIGGFDQMALFDWPFEEG